MKSKMRRCNRPIIKRALTWTCSYFALLAAHHCCHHQTDALAQSAHGKIVSRKSDGRYTTYFLDNMKEETFDKDISGRRGEELQKLIHPSATLRRVQSALRSTFLPDREIDVLSKTGYLRYAVYDNIQDLSTSLRSVLATQRILEGVGVGRAGATALSATLNFLIRDGCGMIASLLFTSYAAHSFRRNIKRWKFFADIMVDFGITLEVIAPSVLSYPALSGLFLPLLCLGNVGKALCGVAAGACGGALQMHWAVKVMGTEEGISEVAAKGGAQRTVMGGTGLVLAALLAKRLGSCGVRSAIGLYCLLTAVHLFSNYRSLKLVALNWLNGWRLHLLVDEFLNCVSGEGNEKGEGKAADRSIIVSNPMDASKKEPLLFLPEWRSIKSEYPIRMGLSFNQFAQLAYRPPSFLVQRHLGQKRNQGKHDNYILTVGRQGTIIVGFFANSHNREKAKAYLHCLLARRALISSHVDCKVGHHVGDEILIDSALETAQNELGKLWPLFEKSATDSGWILDKTECTTEGYEMYFE